MRPYAIQIDASAHCQLACPSCPTADGSTKPALGAGHLSVERFEALLDANPYLREIELSNYGELFLNPRLIDLLRIAQERGVSLHANNGANLNHASEATLEALVRYRMQSMTVSIDGASPETYAKYRRKGDFDRVLAHIQRINLHKKEQSSAYPILNWQFIVFGHNEHEIDRARQKAAELGMGFVTKISWDDAVSPIQNRQLVQLQTRRPVISREEYYKATGRDYMRPICYQLWHAPVLNWDGRVLGCCRNFWGDFGNNAFQDGLEASLESESINRARAMLQGKAEPHPEVPCTTCDLYRRISADKTWITKEEIERAAPTSGHILGIVVNGEDSEATHVDLFLRPGKQVEPMLFLRPPQAVRLEVRRSPILHVKLRDSGQYLLYVLPRKVEQDGRSSPVAMKPFTVPVSIKERPVHQELQLSLARQPVTT
jgi:MoaA/NifB/PqqE/SkfB family radical SAM enzyme